MSRDKDSKGQWKKGNKANMKSGLRSGLALSAFPPQCGLARKHINRLKARITDQLQAEGRLDSDGYPDLACDCLINTILSAERRRRLAEIWLTRQWKKDELANDECLRLLDHIARATDQRDRAMRDLGIIKPEKSEDIALVPSDMLEALRATRSDDQGSSQSEAQEGEERAEERAESEQSEGETSNAN